MTFLMIAALGLAAIALTAGASVALGSYQQRPATYKTYNLSGKFARDHASKVTMRVVVRRRVPVRATHVFLQATYYCNDGQTVTGSGVEKSHLGTFTFKKKGKRYHAVRVRAKSGKDVWDVGFFSKDGKKVSGVGTLTKHSPDSPSHPCANEYVNFTAAK